MPTIQVAIADIANQYSLPVIHDHDSLLFNRHLRSDSEAWVTVRKCIAEHWPEGRIGIAFSIEPQSGRIYKCDQCLSLLPWVIDGHLDRSPVKLSRNWSHWGGLDSFEPASEAIDTVCNLIEHLPKPPCRNRRCKSLSNPPKGKYVVTANLDIARVRIDVDFYTV
jgi:hypothetical protein